MGVSRRGFLAGSAAALATRPGFATGIMEDLSAAPAHAMIAPDGYDPTPVWAYGGSVPGPAIRVPQGGRIGRRLLNGLEQATSVHWHGIRIDNAMDGVPGLTQEAVPPGGTFDYGFTVPDAGTYWYHPHNRTWEQLARGLYGALVVEEADPLPVDRDEVLLIDDWRLDGDATIHESFGQMHDWAHGGRLGNWVTVNGQGEYAQPVRQHERLRLRLVNVANARIFPLEMMGIEAHLIALDGMPLEVPQRVERLGLGPAQRADLIVDVVAEEGTMARIVEPDAQGALAVADFPVTGRARARVLEPPGALPPNPMPVLEALAGRPVARLSMEGGAMRGLADDTRRGAFETGAEDRPPIWALAGVAGMPEEPFLSLGLGETARIALQNETAFPHGMHLHGHHFREVRGDSLGPWRDTILVSPGQQTEVAFLADNPGDWLLHCHMVEHAAGGMMTWIRVS